MFGGPPADVRRRIAYVLQAQHTPANLPVTVREVVTLGRTPRRGLVGRMHADDRAAVQDAIDRVELGSLAGRHLSDLSGGQRQRAFVAQGLAQQRRSPAARRADGRPGRDVDRADPRRAQPPSAAAGRSVVVATHDLEDAAASDHVVLLAGRVVAAGPPAEALARANLHAAYIGRLLDVAGDTVLVDDDAHHHDHG